MAPEIVALIMIGVLVVLLASGTRIAIALGLTAVIVAVVIGWNPHVIGYPLYGETNSYFLTCLPLFVLMGAIFIHSGVAESLFRGLTTMFGSFPGGLLHVNVAASTLFAAMSGSSVAGTATIGGVSYEEEIKRGYPPDMITGSLVCSGTLGILIPPSIPLIVYATMVNESIGRLFVAGIIPGLIVALVFMIYIFLRAVVQKRAFPQGGSYTVKQKAVALRELVLPLATVTIVLGGIYLGLTTPTEAGAMGAAIAIIIALARRKLSLSMLKQAGLTTLTTTCMIMVLMALARAMSTLLSYVGLPDVILGFINDLELSTYVVLLMLWVMYIILGMFLDPMSVMILTLPIVAPIVVGLGFNLIWFGIVLIMFIEMGLITPPVGLNLFVMQKMARDVPVGTIIKGSLPFLALMIVVVWLLTFFPGIVLLLPNLM